MLHHRGGERMGAGDEEGHCSGMLLKGRGRDRRSQTHGGRWQRVKRRLGRGGRRCEREMGQVGRQLFNVLASFIVFM